MLDDAEPREASIAGRRAGLALMAATIMATSIASAFAPPPAARDFTDRRQLKALRKAAVAEAMNPPAKQRKFRHNRRG